MPHYLDKEPEPIDNHLAPEDIDEDDPKIQAILNKPTTGELYESDRSAVLGFAYRR